VARILVRGGRAVGVALANGDEYRAPVVASNAGANVTFLRLLDRDALPAAFVADVERISYASASLKINVALAELQSFRALPGTGTRTTSSAPSTTPSTAAPPRSPSWSARFPRSWTRRSRRPAVI
jgi:phytoene dehydrogenase-like protein